MADTVDFDLHGLLGLRLVSPAPGDVAAVRRQTGLEPVVLPRPPNLTIEFVDQVDHLDQDGPARLLGVGDAAFTDTSFFVQRSAGRPPAYLELPFDRLGAEWRLRCARGSGQVPLLIQLLNLTALANDVLPLHASAFEVGGTGVLVTGWAKGGKTETLLGFMAEGATHVGDEWVYLPEGRRQAYGIPEPMRVWDSHLDQLPTLRSKLSVAERLRLRGVGAMAEAAAGLGSLPGSAGAVARRTAALLERQRFVHIRPADAFGSEQCRLSGRMDVVVLVMSHASPETVVREMTSEEVSQRMLASLHYERQRLLGVYQQFRFAFPERVGALVDEAGAREEALLRRSLEGLPAFLALHPYPVDIPALVRALDPVLRS